MPQGPGARSPAAFLCCVVIVRQGPVLFLSPYCPPGRVPNAGSFISLARWAALRLRGHYLSGALGYEGAQVAAWRGQPVQPLSVLSLSRHRHSWPKRLVIIGGVCARDVSYGGSFICGAPTG